MEPGGLRAVRRRPPDGRQRALRARSPRARRSSTAGPWAVTPHASADRPPRSRWSRSWPGSCGARAGPTRPGGARPGRRPDLAPARTCSPCWWPASSPEAPADHLALSGQGVRDVTRVAGGDPALWQQIVAANADALHELLDERARPARRAASTAVAGGDRDALGALLAPRRRRHAGDPGQARRPGRPTASVFVSVPDHPGELARLFADAGASGVNIEDVHIDHDPGRDDRPGGAGGRARARPGATLHVVWNPGAGRPTGRLRRPCPTIPSRPATPTAGRRDRRPVRLGQVQHVARRRLATGAALPRHRRDVPRDDLVDAAARRRRARRRRGRGPLCRARDPGRHRPARPRRSWSTASTSAPGDPHRRGQRRRLPGQRRARGAGPAARAAARRHRRRRASSSRAATSAPSSRRTRRSRSS